MRWIRGSFQAVPTWVVVLAWVVFYVVATVTAGLLVPPWGAVVQPIVQLLLWVVAIWFVLRPWWSAVGSHRPAMDPPGRVLTVAVAALPERRRQWGRAMIAELAGIEGRSARWRFALSCVRATLWLRPAGGWPVLTLVAGVVVAAVAAAGPAVGAAVPGLGVFAASFTGVVGAMVVLAVARSRRPRLPMPAPTVLVTGGVAASIVVTVLFLRRAPAAAEYLPPAAAVFLAVVLAGCLWVAVAAPRWLGTNRLAPHLGGAAAAVFAAWFWLIIRFDEMALPLPVVFVLLPVLGLTPIAVFVGPAFAAARAGRSLRSGLQAAVWTVTAIMPLTYAVWLPEAQRRHAIDGRTWDGEVVAPVGANLADALVFSLGIFPLLCLTFAVLGAGLGARIARPPALAAPQSPT